MRSVKKKKKLKNYGVLEKSKYDGLVQGGWCPCRWCAWLGIGRQAACRRGNATKRGGALILALVGSGWGGRLFEMCWGILWWRFWGRPQALRETTFLDHTFGGFLRPPGGYVFYNGRSEVCKSEWGLGRYL